MEERERKWKCSPLLLSQSLFYSVYPAAFKVDSCSPPPPPRGEAKCADSAMKSPNCEYHYKSSPQHVAESEVQNVLAEKIALYLDCHDCVCWLVSHSVHSAVRPSPNLSLF